MQKEQLLKFIAQQIEQSEGFRALPYQDTRGKWTIGYGLLLEQQLPDYVIAQLNNDYGDKFEKANKFPDKKLRTQMYINAFTVQPLKQTTASYIMHATLSAIYDELENKVNENPINSKDGYIYWNMYTDIAQMCMLDIAYNIGVNGLWAFSGFRIALANNAQDAIGELLISKRAGQVWGRTKHNCEMLLEKELTLYDCHCCTKSLLDREYSNRQKPKEYYAGLVNAFTEQAYGKKLYDTGE